MAITDYASLQTAVGRWLNKTNLAADIPDFIALAEAEMRRRLRLNGDIVRREFSVDGDYAGVECRAKTITSIRLNGCDDGDLIYATPEGLNAQRAEEPPNRPTHYTVIGNLIWFWPAPDTTYDGVIEYVADFERLSNTCRSNLILEKYPDIYLYGALREAAPFLRDDERVAMWQARFDRAIEQANQDRPMRQRNTSLRADQMFLRSTRREEITT